MRRTVPEPFRPRSVESSTGALIAARFVDATALVDNVKGKVMIDSISC